MNHIRFGLVGLGKHGRHALLPAFSRSRYCNLLAVADRSSENLDKIEDASLRRYGSLNQMLDNEELDAVYIATLASSHCELALQAFEKGLHVICEKPVAASAQEVELMLAAANRAGKSLVVMFENRFKHHYQKIREWIQHGRIGRVEAIHMQSFGSHPTEQPRRTNLLNEAGCLDCGIHMLDLVRFWTGGGIWKEIHALGTWFGEEVVCPPHVGILARLDSGVMVTFEDSFSYAYQMRKVPHNFSRNNLTIVGEKGVIIDCKIGDNAAFQVLSDDYQEVEMVFPMSHSEEIPLVMDHFARVLGGEEEDLGILPNGYDGYMAQRIVDEVNRQCREQRFDHERITTTRVFSD